MRITKYPQSCLLIEGEGRLLIDPGNIVLDAFPLDDIGPVDAVLYTHQHADHFDARALEQLRGSGTAIYANADVCGLIGDGATTVADGQRIEAAGFDVFARDLQHVEMVDGSPGPPNTGFLVDGRLFHPGDGTAIEHLTVDVLALPIAGPSISFRTAYRFLEQVGAETALPIHYDLFIADPDQFARFCDIAKVVVLRHGESAEF